MRMTESERERPLTPLTPRQVFKNTERVGDSLVPGRLTSLDTFRGLIMCALAISGFRFATTAQRLGYGPETEVSSWTVSSWTGHVWQWLGFHTSHPFWNSQFWVVGVSFWDLIQPSFMFMVGVSMPYSYGSRAEKGDSKWRLAGHAIVRSFVLILLGVFLQTQYVGLESKWPTVNVLSQIGFGYFFVYLMLHWRFITQIISSIVVLAAYWAWYSLYPTPEPLPPEAMKSIADFSVLDGFSLPFAHNVGPALHLDLWLFNLLPHSEPVLANSGGYATLNFIPSMITMLFGVMAGTLLRSYRTPSKKVKTLLAGGLVCMLIAVALSFTVCPIVKKIWTPSWTLFSGAWVLWFLAALYWIIDVQGWRRWTFPLVIVGMNSLVMYLLGMTLRGWVAGRYQTYLADEWLRTWAAENVGTQIPEELFAGTYGATIQVIAVFAVFWLFCYYLYRNKLFFRI